MGCSFHYWKESLYSMATKRIPYSEVPSDIGDFLMEDCRPIMYVYTLIDGVFIPQFPQIVDPRPYCEIHGQTMAQGFDEWYCEDCEAQEAEQQRLKSLVQARLTALDARRIRQQQPLCYVFVGRRVPGEIADAPKHSNVIAIRQGDPLPENALHVSDWKPDLMRWYEGQTIRTGPNVRRWKKAGDL